MACQSFIKITPLPRAGRPLVCPIQPTMTPQQQLIEKYGAEASICEIPSEEFENDGLVVQVLRELGIETDALTYVNRRMKWSYTIEEFLDTLNQTNQ
jgi:hypothetical protein